MTFSSGKTLNLKLALLTPSYFKVLRTANR